MGKSKKKKSGKKWWLWLLAAAAVFLLFGGAKAMTWLIDNRADNFRKETVLYVYPGMSPEDVAEYLIDSARVIRPRSLHRAFTDKQVDVYMQPGRYEIKPGQTSVYVARMLNNCWQSPTKLTLSGTLRQKGPIAKKIADQMLVDSASVYAALCDDDLLSQYGFSSRDAFSLIIPDTYEIYWTASAEEIMARFKQAYDDYWTEERLQKAEDLGLTRKEVSILASIVKGETNYEPEMPSIAGVYLNRLQRGMKLQADPTVAYCFDYKLNRVLNSHLKYDSPYNTYIYAGLPPGPICVPTKACLDAVLNPDRHGYLYFCANADFSGTHSFASTLSEHMRNARAFQRALNQRNKARG